MADEIKQRSDPAIVVSVTVVSLVVFWLSYAVTNFASQMVAGRWWYSLPVWTAVHIACAFGSMALARRCCDLLFKSYSGRTPFVLFLLIGIVLIARHFTQGYGEMSLLLDTIVDAFIIAAAFWWFWRGRPSQFYSSRSTPLQ
jgi:hypothetical protein